MDTLTSSSRILLFNEVRSEEDNCHQSHIMIGEIEAAYDLSKKGINIQLMVDCVEHVHILDGIIHQYDAQSEVKQLVSIDLDVSFRPFGV